MSWDSPPVLRALTLGADSDTRGVGKMGHRVKGIGTLHQAVKCSKRHFRTWIISSKSKPARVSPSIHSNPATWLFSDSICTTRLGMHSFQCIRVSSYLPLFRTGDGAPLWHPKRPNGDQPPDVPDLRPQPHQGANTALGISARGDRLSRVGFICLICLLYVGLLF